MAGFRDQVGSPQRAPIAQFLAFVLRYSNQLLKSCPQRHTVGTGLLIMSDTDTSPPAEPTYGSDPDRMTMVARLGDGPTDVDTAFAANAAVRPRDLLSKRRHTHERWQ